MTQFLDENNLLEESQHGYRGGRSTLTQLLKQHDLLVQKLARGKNINVTFLDYSKAFNLVDHSLLLRKIKEKSFRGELLLWLQAFLSNRKQCVRVGQTLSTEVKLHSGVPQDSVLRPLIFLIFIADFEENLDDATATVLKYVYNSKVITIYEWANHNNMKWNQKKFQILRLGNNDYLKDRTDYFAPDGVKVIEWKQAVKDIGVMVDEGLSYNSHCLKAAMKVVQKLGWVRRNFYNRTVPFFRAIWTSLLQPHMDYGSMLTAPFTKCEKPAAEKPLRIHTKMATGCSNLDYWEILTNFPLLSIE